MSQILLAFALQKEKELSIQKICSKLEITYIAVASKDYSQKLGALAGISGFSKNAAIYRGVGFPGEMLVFSGMNSDQVDVFLAEYRASGLSAIGLKAMITPTNVFWTAEELFRELMREHLSL